MRIIPALCFITACHLATHASDSIQTDSSPTDHLPPDITRLTRFGERPDWRHEGKKVVFLGNVFGDVYKYEIPTGRITPCSDHFRHRGFTCAMYLSNGDLLLSGLVAEYDCLSKEARQRARRTASPSALSSI